MSEATPGSTPAGAPDADAPVAANPDSGLRLDGLTISSEASEYATDGFHHRHAAAADQVVAIAEAFRAKGWEVRTQIGVSGFRIDLGIVNPDRAGAYLAGIECDGATYHSSATARDRDKVRQAVLEGLGWTILRIWSTDWFNDPHGETKKMVTHLRAALERRSTS